MSIGATPPIVLRAGEAASTIASMEREIQQHQNALVFSHNETFAIMRIQTDLQNARIFSPNKVQELEAKLMETKGAQERLRDPLRARIAELRARISTIPTEIRTGTIQGLMDTTANPPPALFPPGILPIITSFLE